MHVSTYNLISNAFIIFSSCFYGNFPYKTKTQRIVNTLYHYASNQRSSYHIEHSIIQSYRTFGADYKQEHSLFGYDQVFFLSTDLDIHKKSIRAGGITVLIVSRIPDLVEYLLSNLESCAVPYNKQCLIYQGAWKYFDYYKFLCAIFIQNFCFQKYY